MDVTRRRALALAAAALVAGGCRAAAAPAPSPTPPAREQDWTPILPASDLAVGRNRFLYAVLDERNRPIVDAQVHLRFFDLSSGSAAPAAETDAVFRGQGLGEKGVYVARVEFPSAGGWGVEAEIRRANGGARTLRTRFEVKPTSATPAVGSPALPTRQPLMKDVADPRQVCTAVPPCAFHDLTVADALELRRPALLLFATPGFCTSAVCGPDLQTVQKLEPDYRGRVSFLHLEIYKDPNTRTPTDAVVEWRLPSEPWVFLVDRAGKIADKLEGGITHDELKEGLERLA